MATTKIPEQNQKFLKSSCKNSTFTLLVCVINHLEFLLLEKFIKATCDKKSYCEPQTDKSELKS